MSAVLETLSFLRSRFELCSSQQNQLRGRRPTQQTNISKVRQIILTMDMEYPFGEEPIEGVWEMGEGNWTNLLSYRLYSVLQHQLKLHTRV